MKNFEDYTLAEIRKICASSSNLFCGSCPFYCSEKECAVDKFLKEVSDEQLMPSGWDFPPICRWTKEDAEKASLLQKLYPDANIIERTKSNEFKLFGANANGFNNLGIAKFSEEDGASFLSLQIGERAYLHDIEQREN